MNDGKIINDPVFGFIKIPHGPLLDIIEHPWMQRLTRIKQLGMTSVVYPSAQHTRFLHSIGSFHLMNEAINSLTKKGIFIFDSEAEAVEAAILMHDIGHGPFSHVLENTLIHGISHEDISMIMMEQINREMKGALTLALKIFKNEYPKKFLHQLISSQLDMDRLDYLRRDSFFTGLTEGNIGSARIIKMLDVAEDNLVIDYKGIYSIENYLISRRLMYWQVYLHKTTVASEKMLLSALNRAKELVKGGHEVFAPSCLKYFLVNDVSKESFYSSEEALNNYVNLDDTDIWSALKEWTKNDDKILSMLASDIINRNLFKVEVNDQQIQEEHIEDIKNSLSNKFGITKDETQYFISINSIQKDMYDFNDDHISILCKGGIIKDISEASDILNVALLSKKNRKYYLCYKRF